MRRILGLMLALSFASPSRAAEIGPQLAFPLPAAKIGDQQLGIHAGLTANLFDTPIVGMGLDAAYHHWPVSSSFKDAFERRFYGLAKIGDPTWEISTLQATGHLKIVPPLRGAFRPWIQLGAGIYRVNPLLEFMGEKMESRYEPGALTSLGFDYEANSRLRLGLDISFHHVWTKDDLGSDFDALEVGTHVLFGRRSL